MMVPLLLLLLAAAAPSPAAASPPSRSPPPRPKPRPPPPSRASPAFPPFPAELGSGSRQFSWLWGRNGELWSPAGRLADWSYVGYMGNERAIPRYPALFNVRDYGAKGDGVADDGDAIVAAIKAASDYAKRLAAPTGGMQNGGRAGAAVLLPAGRYRVTQYIELQQSNVAVRGEGVDRTVLYFPKPLEHVYGSIMAWSCMGGFLTCRGSDNNSTATQFRLARIAAAARRGDRRLKVDTTVGLTVGRWIRLFAAQPLAVSRRGLLSGEAAGGAPDGLGTAARLPARRLLAGNASSAGSGPRRMCGPAGDRQPCRPVTESVLSWQRAAQALGLDRPEEAALVLSGGGDSGTASAPGTLDAYLYMENAVDSGRSPFAEERIRFIARISAVGPGWVELERPLPYDLRPAWRVWIHSLQMPTQHVGFEDFTVQFKWDRYPAHLKALGYNAFYFSGCGNAWIRNIRIVDADNGAEAINCDMVTMRNITLLFTRPRGGKLTQNKDGHHGLWAASSSLVHATEFNFKGSFIHDLTFDVWAQESAFTSGRGVDMSLDMHRGGSHNNLWSNIDVGAGRRTFASSGAGIRGAHAASNNTWWNIYASGKPGARLALPSCDFGPQLNFIGSSFGPPAKGDAGVVGRGSPAGAPTRLFPAYCARRVRWWVEVAREGATVRPKDLLAAMRSTQRARLGGRSSLPGG